MCPSGRAGPRTTRSGRRKRSQRSTGTSQLSKYTTSSEAVTRFQGRGQRLTARYNDSNYLIPSNIESLERFLNLEGREYTPGLISPT